MEPTIGEITMFAGNFAPRGWAFCDGQLLPINSNQALFSILGTTYGGDGRTTFGLPELRGRVPMHPGAGPGLSSRRLGDKSGSENNTLTLNQLPSHHHAINASEEANSTDPSGNYIAGSGANMFSSVTDSQSNGNATANTGGNQPVNNIQPYQCVNYIIALVGIFPSRN